MSENRFTDRRALVTGAGSGIGEAVARGLHAEGAEVLLADRAGHRVRALAAELGGSASALELDVRDEAAVGQAARELDVQDGHGFSRGDLVTATVRRSCRRCAACAAGAPDACLTGDYLERGITRLHGFASELVAEHRDHLVPVPPSLGRLGVLAEPAPVCARSLRHLRAIGERQPWQPRRALVLGTGAVGMLSTAFLRQREREPSRLARSRRAAGSRAQAVARGPRGARGAAGRSGPLRGGLRVRWRQGHARLQLSARAGGAMALARRTRERSSPMAQTRSAASVRKPGTKLPLTSLRRPTNGGDAAART